MHDYCSSNQYLFISNIRLILETHLYKLQVRIGNSYLDSAQNSEKNSLSIFVIFKNFLCGNILWSLIRYMSSVIQVCLGNTGKAGKTH